MRSTLCSAAIVVLLAAETVWAQSGDRYAAPPTSGGRSPYASEATQGDRQSLFDGLDSRAGNQGGGGGQSLPSATPPSQSLPAAPPRTNAPQAGTAQSQPAAPASPPSTYPANSPYAASPPATNTDPSARTVDYAESLIKASLTQPASSQLVGDRVYLRDVVNAAGSRSGQSEAIDAYWDLCSATADYYLSLHEQNELGRLAGRSGQTQALREALTKLNTRRDTALIAARATQMRLAAIMGRDNARPLPGDMPLCAMYHTRYSQNFGEAGPQEAAELNRLLPLRHAELLAAAANVAEAEDLIEQYIGQQGISEMQKVKGLELLALSRRAFVQICRDYNKRIARYTELARPGQLRAERLVSMLIKSDGNVASRPAVQPTSRDRSGVQPPPTFRDDEANPLRSAPMLDSEVLPTGGTEEPNLVEKVVPGETSVLIHSDRQ